MDQYIKRIHNIDDFSKLYAELKALNRLIIHSPQDEEEIKFKKKLVEDRLSELMYVVTA